MDILFQNVTAVTMDEAAPVLQNAYVQVSGKHIVSVGTEAPEHWTGRIIDGRNKILMPGLVNGHTHIPMTLLRGYADGYDLQTWLNDYIFPAEARLDARAVRAGSMLALAEMIACGTASFSDMYYFCDEIIEATVEVGLQANIARGTTVFTDDFSFDSFPACVELRQLVDRWHGFDEDRILIDACIHGEYTSGPSLWAPLAEYAQAHGLGMHVHVSETKQEHEDSLRRHGLTPAQALDRYGVWNSRAIAAHGVWLSPEDMALFAEKGVSVIHNPVSNGKLGSGVAPVPALRKAGVNVALGTDGVSSNNSHDLFEEMKAAVLFAKATTLDANVLTAADALAMATRNGYASQGRMGGKIAAGFPADLILVDTHRPHLNPCHDVLSNLVYAARGSDVVLNMVRGRILYEDGNFLTLDLDRVLAEVRDYAIPKVFG